MDPWSEPANTVWPFPFTRQDWERMLSLKETCRLQAQSTYTVLVDAVSSLFTHRPLALAWIGPNRTRGCRLLTSVSVPCNRSLRQQTSGGIGQ